LKRNATNNSTCIKHYSFYCARRDMISVSPSIPGLHRFHVKTAKNLGIYKTFYNERKRILSDITWHHRTQGRGEIVKVNSFWVPTGTNYILRLHGTGKGDFIIIVWCNRLRCSKSCTQSLYGFSLSPPSDIRTITSGILQYRTITSDIRSITSGIRLCTSDPY
jgi:hypothetical protein